MVMLVIVLGLVAVIGCVATLVVVQEDAPRPGDLPPTRYVAPDLRPPADSGGHGVALQHWARGRS